MCHNLGSSTYQGYCNEYHLKKAMELDLKEKLSTVTASLSLAKDSVTKAPPSKEPASTLPDKQK